MHKLTIIAEIHVQSYFYINLWAKRAYAWYKSLYNSLQNSMLNVLKMISLLLISDVFLLIDFDINYG